MALRSYSESKYACAHVVSMYSIKGNGQVLTPAIIPVAACCLVQKVTYFVKDMRIEREHKLTLKSWDPELTRECSDIRAVQVQRLLCAYSTGHSQLDRLVQVFSDLHLCTCYFTRSACER